MHFLLKGKKMGLLLSDMISNTNEFFDMNLVLYNKKKIKGLIKCHS